MNYPDKWNTKPRLLTVGGTQIHYTVYNRRPRCTDRPDLYRLHTHQTGIQPEIRKVQNAIHTTLLPHILTMELQFCRTVFQPTSAQENRRILFHRSTSPTSFTFGLFNLQGVSSKVPVSN